MPQSGLAKKFAASLTGFLLMLVTCAAVGQCHEPKVPAFPTSDVADLQTMEIVQAEMQRYITDAENYLDCLGADQGKQQMDRVLATMKHVTSEYNALMAAYRKRKTEQLFSNGAK